MIEILNQLQQLLLTSVLLAQAYGEGVYGGTLYSGEGSASGGFNLPLPNTGQGLLFWGGLLLLALAIGVLAWRWAKKRKQAKAATASKPADQTDQLLKY